MFYVHLLMFQEEKAGLYIQKEERKERLRLFNNQISFIGKNCFTFAPF